MPVVRNDGRLLFPGAVQLLHSIAIEILHATMPMNILLMLHIPKHYSVATNIQQKKPCGELVTRLLASLPLGNDSTIIL